MLYQLRPARGNRRSGKMAEVFAPCIREAEQVLRPQDGEEVERIDVPPQDGRFDAGKRRRPMHTSGAG